MDPMARKEAKDANAMKGVVRNDGRSWGDRISNKVVYTV
jgi:hypothetical protein